MSFWIIIIKGTLSQKMWTFFVGWLRLLFKKNIADLLVGLTPLINLHFEDQFSSMTAASLTIHSLRFLVIKIPVLP